VVFTAKLDGTVEVWDFLDRSHEASMITRINSGAIAALKFWQGLTLVHFSPQPEPLL